MEIGRKSRLQEKHRLANSLVRTSAGQRPGMETADMPSLDSFRCCKTLQVGSKTYAYFSLPTAERNGLKGISRLPFSMKVLLENLLRNEDGRTVTKDDIQAFAQDRKSTRLNSSHVEISYAVFCLKKKKKKRIRQE